MPQSEKQLSRRFNCGNSNLFDAVAGKVLRGPELPISQEDLPEIIRPGTTGDELERVIRTINWLKEDTDKARAVGAGLPGTSTEKKVG
jgi:hypothetical protein